MLRKIQNYKRKIRAKLKNALINKCINSIFDYYEDGIAVKNKNLSHFQDKPFHDAYAVMMAGDHANFNFPSLKWRCHTAIWAAGVALNIEGDYIELGVNTGIFSRTICEYYEFQNIDKNFYLFDTFDGVPNSDNYTLTKSDMKRNIGYTGTFQAATDNFKKFPNAHLIKGNLPKTLDLVQINKIAYICIDLNNAYYETFA
jgi:O-methyltransferase